jgi:hypothetical protein
MFMSKLRMLSVWAKMNPVKARYIIGFCHALFFVLGIIVGGLLFGHNVKINLTFFAVAIFIFLGAYFFYPNKKAKKLSVGYSYSRQKTFDFTLVISSWLLIIIAANNFSFYLCPNNEGHYAQLTAVHLNVGSENSFVNTSPKKNFRQSIQSTINKIKDILLLQKEKTQSQDRVGQGILNFLVVILGLLLGTLVASLSCKLSCSGKASAAGLVLILGFGGIIVGGIYAIRAILNRV